MKTPRQLIAALLAAVMSLVLATATVTAKEVPQASNNSEQAQLAPWDTRQAKAQVAQKTDFDGHRLYQQVLSYLISYDNSLVDPAKRAKWAAEWENKHATDGQLDTEDGTDKAIFEMMYSLGHRFNFYNPPKANAAEQEQNNATLTGIGTPIAQKGIARALKALEDNPSEQQVEERLKLLKLDDSRPLWIPDDPFAGGPAEKAGLRVGDIIVKVDEKPVAGLTINEAVDKIRGTEGTRVKITYRRDDGKGGVIERTVEITRARVTTRVVKTKDMGAGISYIRLSDFSSKFAEKEMLDALSKAANGKAVIIDLRSNPGGRLDAAESIAEFLLPQGHVLTIKRREGDEILESRTYLQPTYAIEEQSGASGRVGQGIRSRSREELLIPSDMPMVVLVDQNSASASEILAGLLKANKRATIVGKTTIGKGVGQSVLGLPFNRNIHITTFEFLPGGQGVVDGDLDPRLSGECEDLRNTSYR